MSKLRKRLCLGDKLKVIEDYEKSSSVKSISLKYAIPKSSVFTIIKNKEKIKSHLEKTHNMTKKRLSLRKGEYHQMEKHLNRWFINQRENHVPISAPILKAKAKTLYQKYYQGDFNASDGWLTNFKKRFGIRLLKISGEKLSANAESVEPFKVELKNVIEEHALDKHAIFNADETGLYWKALPGKTYVQHCEKTAPGRKMYKERITFLACANATGSKKIKPLIIGKAKKPRSFNKKSLPVHYMHSKNAWMTTDIFKKWFFNIFVPEVEDFLIEMNLPKKALLILDNAPSHPPAEELVKNITGGKVWVIYMPPNVTPLLQPMDQNAIRLTKLFYQNSLLTNIVSSNCVDIGKALKNFTLFDAISLLALSWRKVSKSTLEKCWNKLLKSEMDEFDEEDEIPLATLRNLEEMNTVTHTIGVLNQIFPNSNISAGDVLLSTEEECPVEEDAAEISSDSDNEISLEENIHPVNEKHADIALNFTKCIKWAHENNIDSSKILVLVELREQATQFSYSQETLLKQSTITNFFTSK